MNSIHPAVIARIPPLLYICREAAVGYCHRVAFELVKHCSYRVCFTQSNIVDRGKEGVVEHVYGLENGWRARRTEAGVNAMDGAGGCY